MMHSTEHTGGDKALGIIWLQTTFGQLIHLPVVGSDVNSPDDQVKIPTSVIGIDAMNKEFSDKIPVDILGKGNVIFDFGVPGRTGSCKRCGKCCGECQYLIIRPGEQAVCDIRMNIFNIAKGCTLSPSKINDIENYPDCGFKFDMED